MGVNACNGAGQCLLIAGQPCTGDAQCVSNMCFTLGDGGVGMACL
jgi:hypothetical protein